MHNPEKLATQGTQNEEKKAKINQYGLWWTPLCVSKHKQRKYEMSPPMILQYYVEIVTAITTLHAQVNSKMADSHM